MQRASKHRDHYLIIDNTRNVRYITWSRFQRQIGQVEQDEVWSKYVFGGLQISANILEGKLVPVLQICRKEIIQDIKGSICFESEKSNTEMPGYRGLI